MRLVFKLGLFVGAVLSFQTLAASFTTPYFFELKYIDDQRVSSIWSSEEGEELDTGPHRLLVRYIQKVTNNNNDEIMLSSDYFVVYLDVSQDMTKLALIADEPRNFFMAEKFAKAPEFDIVDQEGNSINFENIMLPKVDGFQLGRNYRREMELLDKERAKTLSPSKVTEPATQVNIEPTQTTEYEMLQKWYSKADEATRKAYKIWTIDSSQVPAEISTELEMLQFWHNKADEATLKAFQYWLVQ